MMGAMLKEINLFFLQQDEPLKSCLQALRIHILAYNPQITEAWKFKMPFYYYKNERFCYMWVNKKTQQPYIGFTDGKLLDHPKLIAEKRSRMKILQLNASEKLPLETINELIKMAIDFL